MRSQSNPVPMSSKEALSIRGTSANDRYRLYYPGATNNGDSNYQRLYYVGEYDGGAGYDVLLIDWERNNYGKNWTISGTYPSIIITLSTSLGTYTTIRAKNVEEIRFFDQAWFTPVAVTTSAETQSQQTSTTPPASSPPSIPAVATATFHIYDATVVEGGVATVRVTRSGNTQNAQSIQVYTRSGSAYSGYDFEVLNTSIFFPPGATEGSTKIFTINDSQEENTESFELFGNSIAGGTINLISNWSKKTGLVTIIDNDKAAPVATPTFPTVSGISGADSGAGSNQRPVYLKLSSIDQIDPITRQAVLQATPLKSVESVVLVETPVFQNNAEADRITGFNTRTDVVALSRDVVDQQSIVFASAKNQKAFNKQLKSNSNVIYNQRTGELVYDANGRRAGLGDGGGVLAVFEEMPGLSKNNFVLLAPDVLG